MLLLRANDRVYNVRLIVMGLALIGVAGFILGMLVHKAIGASYDPVIQYFESVYHVHPGEPLPADMRTPDTRLIYQGASPVGHSCYAVKICRIQYR